MEKRGVKAGVSGAGTPSARRSTAAVLMAGDVRFSGGGLAGDGRIAGGSMRAACRCQAHSCVSVMQALHVGRRGICCESWRTCWRGTAGLLDQSCTDSSSKVRGTGVCRWPGGALKGTFGAACAAGTTGAKSRDCSCTKGSSEAAAGGCVAASSTAKPLRAAQYVSGPFTIHSNLSLRTMLSTTAFECSNSRGGLRSGAHAS